MPRTNNSKYDEYFDINHTTKKSKCRTCGDILSKNCDGMRKHLRLRHDIIVPKQNSNSTGVGEEYELQSPRKKSKTADVEPIEDQITKEVAKYGASFR